MTNVRYEDEKGTDEIRVYSLDGTDALDGSDDDGGEDFDEEDDDGEENYEEEKGNSKDGEIGIYSVDGTQLHLAAAPRVTRGQLLYTACNCYSAYTSGREQFCTII